MYVAAVQFQLHHTGIKTIVIKIMLKKSFNFNCTIQELKLRKFLVAMRDIEDFNCTIQELKLRLAAYSSKYKEDFNCTIQELKQNTVS